MNSSNIVTLSFPELEQFKRTERCDRKTRVEKTKKIMYDDFYSDSDSDGFEFTSPSDLVFSASSLSQGQLSSVIPGGNDKGEKIWWRHSCRRGLHPFPNNKF